jgi:hypothetical protein
VLRYYTQQDVCCWCQNGYVVDSKRVCCWQQTVIYMFVIPLYLLSVSTTYYSFAIYSILVAMNNIPVCYQQHTHLLSTTYTFAINNILVCYQQNTRLLSTTYSFTINHIRVNIVHAVRCNQNTSYLYSICIMFFLI